MIEIPRGSAATPTATPSSTATPPAAAATSAATSAADVAADSVAKSLEAVVVEVKARQASGNLEKPAWDILLKLNPAATASAGAVPVSSLTPEQLRALQNGQALLVRTQAPFPLPADTRLNVNATAGQGIAIQQILPPGNSMPQQLVALLKQWVPAQQSALPLLANVLQLLSRSSAQTLATLPAPLQAVLQQLAQTLPNPDQIRQPGQMQAVVQHSGLLLEAKLASLIAHLQKLPLDTDAPTGEPHAPNLQPNPSPAGTLAGLARAVRESFQRLMQDSPDSSETSPATNAKSSATTTPVAPDLADALGKDFKLALQKLEVALRDAQGQPAADKNAAQAKPGTAALAPAQADADTAAAGKNATPVAEPGAETPEQLLARLMNRNARSGQPGVAGTERAASHPGIQRYADAVRGETRLDTGKPTAADLLLLPPLPGQVLVQPHPRSRPTLKGDEMADAIVNILLKQVRGALARMTLHQLTSSAQKQDNNAQPTLSFEVPFLHAGQVDMFQFKIEQEPQTDQERRDKSLTKRWQVQLGFDIEGLGPMFCQLSLAGNNMAVTFWAAWENTLAQTKAHFNFLEQALTDMGIHVEKMQGHLGIPENDRTGVRNQLVDIKT
ncbi:MAG: flagellar hook-length control protein FliK [Pseudomonadota bacterium]